MTALLRLMSAHSSSRHTARSGGLQRCASEGGKMGSQMLLLLPRCRGRLQCAPRACCGHPAADVPVTEAGGWTNQKMRGRFRMTWMQHLRQRMMQAMDVVVRQRKGKVT